MNHFISLISILLLTIVPSSFAWNFLLTEGQTRCIYEELPKNEV